ncbi:MAG: hypothetical protein ACK56I_34070, partial [bacterium]
VGVRAVPEMGPDVTIEIAELHVEHGVVALEVAHDDVHRRLVAVRVEVAVGEATDLGIGGEDAVHVLAQQAGLRAAHLGLVGLRDFAHGFQVDAEEARVEAVAAFHGDIE